jgi:hypothetical protein
MTEDAQARRRKSRREEWGAQTALAEMLPRYIDPQTVFWTSIENRPRSWVSGLLQKRRGVRSGLPDLMFISSEGRFHRSEVAQRPRLASAKAGPGLLTSPVCADSLRTRCCPGSRAEKRK